MSKPQSEKSSKVNGLDVDALRGVIEEVKKDPAKGMVGFSVTSRWQGQTRSQATVESYRIGGEEVKRQFKINVDEPLELLGENTAPNPQELLMTALNACITVGYVAGAAVKGITLEKVEIETTGQLDLSASKATARRSSLKRSTKTTPPPPPPMSISRNRSGSMPSCEWSECGHDSGSARSRRAGYDGAEREP